MKRINDLPEDIRALGLRRISESDWQDKDEVLSTNPYVAHLFNWQYTPEGRAYWAGVSVGTITELPNANNSNIKP